MPTGDHSAGDGHGHSHAHELDRSRVFLALCLTAGSWFAAIILRSTWFLLRDSGHILLEGTPVELDVREIGSELDESKRQEMYVEMQRNVRDEGGALISLFASYVIGLSTKVAHAEAVSDTYDLDGAKLLERWWFA